MFIQYCVQVFYKIECPSPTSLHPLRHSRKYKNDSFELGYISYIYHIVVEIEETDNHSCMLSSSLHPKFLPLEGHG